MIAAGLWRVVQKGAAIPARHGLRNGFAFDDQFELFPSQPLLCSEQSALAQHRFNPRRLPRQNQHIPNRQEPFNLIRSVQA